MTFAEQIAKYKLAKFGLSDALSEISLLFELSLHGLRPNLSSAKGSAKG